MGTNNSSIVSKRSVERLYFPNEPHFFPEVSITYMPTESADALIQWANKLPDARFCLLEQLLPEGISHPFAQTMMAHFDKLGTPLGACKKYPTVAAQDTRFRSLGWPSVLVRNLWELWGSEDFLDSKERIALDSVEPFDEWEEFALFGCHYLLLVADNTSTMHRQAMQESCEPTLNGPGANHTTSTYSEYPKAQGQRRFAAPLSVRARNRGQYAIGNFSGMGLNTRVSSCDVYSADDTGFTSFDYQGSHSWPSSRMCHTITGIDDGASLLIGGRTSPDNAIVDCWIYHKWLNIWERVDDLPKPRYRHSAAHLGNGYVMMTGGKSTSKTLVDDVMIWSRQRGWVKCSINSNERPPAFFGSSLVVYPETFPHPSASRSGIIAGGITEDGLVQEKTWKWKISQYRDEQPSISFKNFDSPSTKAENGATLARFGAQTLVHEDNIVVVGGIVKDILLPLANEICSSKIESMSTTQHVVCCTSVSTNLEPRPLLIGTSAVSSGDKILIMGGSAVIVHEASTEHMNFSSKNFTYVTKKFGDFLDEVEKGSKLYLRSLSAEKASELPADIVKDYPSISADFQLPLELASVTHNAHSSPLRISGPVNMWLHYDVMANVLCQVRGSKRLLLFPPSDVKYFDFAPGASSSSINVFENLSDPKLSHTHPHEVILQPGDILFLPSLWLHTASPTSGISVAVNVFFRNLRNGYAAGKDVYGNRDLQAYEKGRQDIAKVVKSFESLPTDVRGFYLQRLADEFMQMAT
ncbi:hypothetical protein SS1G_09585 [Sclerotinia sclerotiorum 1980 UF-70]|uniref:JmjC domain-containing protein n=1 Tax=Sclerotinia sclerotiorum (strain ATCC 18683 / 1980 / Ss-1) TaxID=665079 RepID=A7EW76_SCLS1|nr:hypothetical protein SS1G_09585 [Sclerotinia sclerotiorum 1980 UF-70]EDN93718.1 hypothetical protein SS1G_09585 [Sclerotinia sclerotiorum 1980 UF-70]